MSLFDDQEIAKWFRAMPPTFWEWLEQADSDNIAKLCWATDMLTVGRFQGKLEILATLKQLRKES
jgi:hypothetical protein